MLHTFQLWNLLLSSYLNARTLNGLGTLPPKFMEELFIIGYREKIKLDANYCSESP